VQSGPGIQLDALARREPWIVLVNDGDKPVEIGVLRVFEPAVGIKLSLEKGLEHPNPVTVAKRLDTLARFYDVLSGQDELYRSYALHFADRVYKELWNLHDEGNKLLKADKHPDSTFDGPIGLDKEEQEMYEFAVGVLLRDLRRRPPIDKPGAEDQLPCSPVSG